MTILQAKDVVFLYTCFTKEQENILFYKEEVTYEY